MFSTWMLKVGQYIFSMQGMKLKRKIGCHRWLLILVSRSPLAFSSCHSNFIMTTRCLALYAAFSLFPARTRCSERPEEPRLLCVHEEGVFQRGSLGYQIRPARINLPQRLALCAALSPSSRHEEGALHASRSHAFSVWHE